MVLSRFLTHDPKCRITTHDSRMQNSLVKKHLLLISFILFCNSLFAQEKKFNDEWLSSPKKFASEIENAFETELIPVYTSVPSTDQIILENGYAQSQLKNSGLWKPLNQNFKIDTVSLIYTQYPKDKNFWLTDYHLLLAQRLKILFQLDGELNAACSSNVFAGCVVTIIKKHKIF